jgi:protein AroM
MPEHKAPKVAFVTIGQAPRHDLSAAFTQNIAPSIEVIHAGVLDGFDRLETEQRFGAKPDRPSLITRMRDGSAVTLDADSVGHSLATLISRLDQQGDIDVIVLLCTGEFPALHTRHARLVEPDRVVFLSALFVHLICNNLRQHR